MLKPEAAKKKLAQWIVVDDAAAAESRFIPAVRKLPVRLRNAGYMLLGLNETGNEDDDIDQDERQEFIGRQRAAFESFSKAERTKLLRVFFGGLAVEVETTWQWLKQAPYQADDFGPAFRAPRNPELTCELRYQWLRRFTELTAPYDTSALTPTWLATWGAYSTVHADDIGKLLAAHIDSGGKQSEEVFEILCASARREHEIGRLGRHVTTALLSASQKDGWALMAKMLLAAQRQEGLRQSILEDVVWAHPDAFRHILRVIVDGKLARFSSVVQALNGWLGYSWAAGAARKVNDTLEVLLTLLEEPAERKKALAGDEAEHAFLALWALAFEDAAASIPPARKLLRSKDVEMRYVAALHLTRVGSLGAKARLAAVGDDDVRVGLVALEGARFEDEFESAELDGPGLFDTMESLCVRLPSKPKALKPLVWPWTEMTVRRSQVADNLSYSLGKLPPTRLIPHLKAMEPWGRHHAIGLLGSQKKWDKLTRDTIFDSCGDAAMDTRQAAFEALHNTKVTPAECQRLESLLTRKSADVRAGVIALTLKLTDTQALSSASRLMESSNKEQRLAGLEILRQLADADRARAQCIKAAANWAGSRRRILKAEQTQLDAIAASTKETLTLDNALGLMDPTKRTPRFTPKVRKVRCASPSSSKILKALDGLVHKHRSASVTYELRGYGASASETLTDQLGQLAYSFPAPDYDKPLREVSQKLPLREVWEEWFTSRPAAQKDRDGLELTRTRMLLKMKSIWDDDAFKECAKWARKSSARKPFAAFAAPGGKVNLPKLKYQEIVEKLLDWLLLLHPEKGGIDFVQDVVETMFALIPEEDHQPLLDTGNEDDEQWSDDDDVDSWRSLAVICEWRSCSHAAAKRSKAQQRRQWRLDSWYDEPIDGAKRSRPELDDFVTAFANKDANLTDFLDQLLGPCNRFEAIGRMTTRRVEKNLQEFAGRKDVAELVDQCVSRVLEIELGRGESATLSSSAALSIQTYRGIGTLRELLKALGIDGFKKIRSWSETVANNRLATLTDMAGKTWPVESETPAEFAKQMRAALRDDEFPEERLLQLAFLAPQWTECIEAALNWDGFTEALYWYMAHMTYVWGMTEGLDDRGTHDESDGEHKPRKMSRWDRILAERTPLSKEERDDGAIDVAWFHRTYKQLTPQRWEAMAAAARFASSPAGAKRATMIGEVLLGKITKSQLVADIRKKRLKETVRLLGLLPLAPGAQRDKDLIDRYEVLQEYRRYANTLSAMTRPDALSACEIGLRNLASTAGYADPMRLQWAMEAESTSDVAAGPIVVKKGDVSLTLQLDDQAVPELTIRRGDKVLKSLPKTVNKDKKFVELRERSTHLKRQASRVKQSLEQAMVRGDSFTGGELAMLSDHAILWPQLERLVLVGEGIMGYPVKRGKALQNHAGQLEPVKKKETMRIAHPHDLLKSKHWSKWQHDCFARERLQPFKQVFRELYVVTKQEKADGGFSNRYAGQQVNPKHAHALWGRRGWNVDEYDGVWKTYPDERITVTVSFDHGYTTPLEVEGLTIEQVQFIERDKHKALKLSSVPPMLFSEVMRDMDLVVSVAHAGEVDPEASASTVEMRESLLKETCRLLNLKNVRFKDSRATIAGQLGDYTVHLGSGVVHRMPGGSVCIVPVHAQHRGRLFLPFADDDPRTAEVMAKTLLLARDDEIDDPIILDQLREMA